MGDGVLASFPTGSAAVYCAKEIQEACLKEDDLKLRIGIHQGEVVFEDEDVFGDGVNIASRLEPLAPIGGILVSESVNRNLGNKKGIATKFLREENLKNVKEPVRIYEVMVERVYSPNTHSTTPSNSAKTPKGLLKPLSQKKLFLASLGIILILLLAYFTYDFLNKKESLIQPTATKIIDKSIAVLPFRDDSQEKDNQYFCDGMMEEILTHLQKIADISVKSRTSVEQYRNTTKTIESIAEELNVHFLLEGSVRKYGGNFRITAQLIEASSGDHLWAETFDGAYTDTIFIVQANIAKRIASSLNVVITPVEAQRIEHRSTSDISAYDYWLKGLEFQKNFNYQGQKGPCYS